MRELLWTPPATVVQGNALTVPALLADASVSMIATSPPFFGLRSYNTPPQVWPDGWVGELGQEPTVAQYVAHLVSVFAAWRPKLHPAGVLFVNLGDSYSNDGKWGGKSGGKNATSAAGGYDRVRKTRSAELGPKQLLGVPWRFAFAMQDAGWILRADVVWAKGNPMPESVTDRFTRSHEYVFMFAQQARYYFDHVAVQEPSVSDHGSGNGFKRAARQSFLDADGDARGSDDAWELRPTRNKRDVWNVNSVPFTGPHYATWPPALVEPMVLAGSSAQGVCGRCGAPWARVTEGRPMDYGMGSADTSDHKAVAVNGNARVRLRTPTGHSMSKTVQVTTGWHPSCRCADPTPRPALVADPFSGAGTTGGVAVQHGRHYLGVDLNADTSITLARVDRVQLTLLEDTAPRPARAQQPALWAEEVLA